MKQRTTLVLLATLASTPVWSQEVSVYGTTLAQVWKQGLPGFKETSNTPTTQFLGIEATQLGSEALSMHLFGWTTTGTGDTNPRKSGADGDLTYGYLRYRLPKANAEIVAGRFTLNQGVGIEQVDGLSARADLKGGFSLSIFGGQPVVSTSDLDPKRQRDLEFQRDFIFGTRLGLRFSKLGEIGLSYLQDGTKAAKDLPKPSRVDYTRKQVGADLRLAPAATLDLSGRTVFDVASHGDPLPGQASRDRIAEHDYSLQWKASSKIAVNGSFTQRNYQAYFAGTNLPSLFRAFERDKHRAFGGSLVWAASSDIELVADARRTHRDSFGDATRVGADLRWNFSAQKLLTGFGFHSVTASDVKLVDPLLPSYSLGHHEVRVWAMYEGEGLSASLDGIYHGFKDRKNPHLNGQTALYEVVGSLGVKVTPEVKLSGDLGVGSTALDKREVKGLLRMEFRFGSTPKGGKK